MGVAHKTKGEMPK